jgi:hypothetical protein
MKKGLSFLILGLCFLGAVSAKGSSDYEKIDATVSFSPERHTQYLKTFLENTGKTKNQYIWFDDIAINELLTTEDARESGRGRGLFKIIEQKAIYYSQDDDGKAKLEVGMSETVGYRLKCSNRKPDISDCKGGEYFIAAKVDGEYLLSYLQKYLSKYL